MIDHLRTRQLKVSQEQSRKGEKVFPEWGNSDLVTLLRQYALSLPDTYAYVFLVDGESQEQPISYRELDAQASVIAAQLQMLGMRGARALLLYPPGLEYITAFFGCLYAGVIAVPAYPPSRHHLHRLRTIVQDATPSVVLTTAELQGRLFDNYEKVWGCGELVWLATDIPVNDIPVCPAPFTVEPDSLAFLQYTSGSTGNPKGVMVSHGNLIANQRIIQEAFGHTQDTVVVGWLPLYHDMGLIGNILQPLYLGSTAILMSPLAFLEQPARWLKAITKYRAGTSGGPNFAYELCIRKLTPQQKQELDLSCWTLAFNGSEPVRASTLARFSNAFAECGFRHEAFFPCYGLAEATLFAAGRRLADKPKEDSTLVRAYSPGQPGVVRAYRSMVYCGHSWGDHVICIVNPETRALCPDGEEGEIWVAGPSVAQGYWNRPQESEGIFRATLFDPHGMLIPEAGLDTERGQPYSKHSSKHTEGYFLRTGDLGIMEEGGLLVTGRIKDLIILRGRNYYPHDLELALDDKVSELRQGCCAAFSVEREGEEVLVIAAEVRRKAIPEQAAKELFASMRAVLAETCDASIGELVLVPPGAILKTSSGKIQRQACKQAYLSLQLTILARSSEAGFPQSMPGQADFDKTDGLLRDALRVLPKTHHASFISRFLLSNVARLLMIPEADVAPNVALRSLGLDSLRAVELKHAVDLLLDKEFPLSIFLSDHTITDLSKIFVDTDSHTSSVVTLPLPEGSGISCAQKAIWMVHQLESQSIVYNLHLALQLHGHFCPVVLRQALDLLLQRHGQLSTLYRMDGEAVRQSLIRHTEMPEYFSVVDATGWSEPEIQSDITRRVREPFNLASGPLLRVVSYRQDDRNHILLFCAHHVAMDLWTGLILLDELKEILAGLLSSRRLNLPKPSANYADFVAWQENYLQSSVCRSDGEYWRTQLAGTLPILALPTDFARPQIATYRGASHALHLDSDLTEKIKQLGRQHGASLFMTLLAAYSVLLHRYTHQDDIIIGTASNGRPQARFTNVAGNFVNPIALRVHPQPALSFATYLEQVRDVVVNGLSHSHYPFSLLVERLQPERNTDHWPIYQTWLMLQQGRSGIDEGLAHLALGEEGERLGWGEWTIAAKELHEQVENFDLRIMAAEDESGLLLSLRYRSDLFEAATIMRMAGHLKALLKSIIAQPASRIGELSLLTEVERTRQLIEWNATAIPFPESGSLHGFFEAQVKRAPSQAAVSCAGVQLTYVELNARANQLAHHLRDRGVWQEIAVGLCVKRSLDMLIGILGILKAGGAYVPIDPDSPQERIAQTLSDCRASLLITHQDLWSGMTLRNVAVIRLDGDREIIAEKSSANPWNPISSNHLAYIIYTSGSTGKPKGVAITHGNAVHSTRARFGFYQSRVDGFLLLSSFTFDSSVAGIFWTLCQAGCVFIPPDGDEKDPRVLGKMLSSEKISHLLCLPTFYGVLLDSIPQTSFHGLKAVVVAGEACPADLAARHHRQLPHAALFNEYGPTEGTVWSSVYQIDGALLGSPDGRPVFVSIGRPVENVQIYLLDNYLNPVPVGVAGELYIGGAGIARGYLHDSGLTAERFIPDFFSVPENTTLSSSSRVTLGGRLYRTGDLARFRPDGNIEFLGRLDHQVKIRGFRIELGEIEAKLRQHPDVKEAVVLAREDSVGDRRLVAYVVVHPSQIPPTIVEGDKRYVTDHLTYTPQLSAFRVLAAEEFVGASALVEQLRRFVRESLPDFMMPSAFVLMQAFPLLPNGKVNRKELPIPAPESGISAPALELTEPGNPVEKVIKDIWTEVLGITTSFGIHDNFFDLGGHSLSAIQVMVRIQDSFKIELAVATIFEAPTIAELADVVMPLQANDQDSVMLESLLDELEHLSDEDARKFLENSDSAGIPKTKQRLYRLADHVIIEPLIDKWVAWPHTFSPVVYGLHLLNYQSEVLASYLKNPGTHIKSCRNPRLIGGPFVDIPEQKAEEVGMLLAGIRQNHADLMGLARDLTEFQNMLVQAATGQSLEGFYEQLPESLRGYIELGYDYHNHPVVRCIESLIYESPYYKREIQSFRISALELDEARSYYMSTPRLTGPDDIEWNMPFDNPAIDTLCKLDICAQPLDDIRELLGVAPGNESRLLTFLSEEPLEEVQPWTGAGVRLRYFGHASVLIEREGVSILTDPFISISPRQGGIERFTFKDLPPHIDYVLITHGHHDHFVFESLLRLRHRIGALVVPRNSGVFYGDMSLKQLAQKLGFRHVHEMDTLDSIPLPGGKITAIPFFGEHCDLLHAKSAYVVSFGSEQILFAADSCCLDRRIYENVKKILGPISTVFIGMECIGAPLSWVYAPLLPIKPERNHDQSRRSHANDAKAALDLLQAVGAQRAYVYALGREPWLKYFMALTPADDDPYMQEVKKLMEATRALGYVDVQMLFGSKELHLETVTASLECS